MNEADAADRDPAPRRPRIGLVGFGELRRAGLEALLCADDHKQPCELIPLSAPKALNTPGLELVLIDAEGVDHLFELLAAFRRSRPQLRLLVLGPRAEFAMIERVIGAGAKGYLDHGASAEDIALAVELVRDGSIWAPRKVLSKLLDQAQEARRDASPEPVRFTVREREVLRLLVLGYPNREIATLLGVDEGTVKAHLSRLMRKAGVKNRIALTMRAIECHWT